MKRLKLFFVLIIFGLVFCSGYTLAEEDDDNVFYLGEVVVTGKSEVISRVATVQTIGKEEIELNEAATVSEALDNMTGLFVSTGIRNEAYINVRGFDQKYVPVFYDGIPWYIPYDGYVDTSEISAGNVARISLSKGAASTLYGANTMGGVINIVSLRPTEKFGGSFRLNLTKDQYMGNLNIGGMAGKFYFMGGLAGLNINHLEMSRDYTPLPGSAEDGNDRENSDRKSLTKTVKIGFMPAEGQEFAIGAHRTEGEKGWHYNVDPDQHPRYRRFPEWEKTTYYFIGNSRITDNLSAKVRIYHDAYYNVLDDFSDASLGNLRWSSTYDDYTDGGSLVLRTDYIDRNIISFAYHIKNDVHQSQGNIGDVWEKYETRTSSYGVEDSFELTDDLNIVAGLNYDIQEATYANGGALRDDDDSWNSIIGMTYSITDEIDLHLSVASKTRFPTQKELYSEFDGDYYPNPNLKKEQSVNYEAGISSAVPFESNVGFILFYSDVKDKVIDSEIWVDEGQGLEPFDYKDNLGKSSFKGLELSFNTTYFEKNNIQLAYAFIDAKNETPGRTSDFMDEVPRHQLRITDQVIFNDMLSIFAKARYEKGQKQDIGWGSPEWIELDDYWLFDLKGVLKFRENAQFELSIKNILDEYYSTSYGFPKEGRNISFGCKITF